MSDRHPGPQLRGRRTECEALERLLARAQEGHSGVVVLRGEPGVGKTALLDHLTRHAAGFRVLRAAGAEFEMELAFAGVHQLCAPLLDEITRLPDPQRDALRVAFGGQGGDVPDRFLVGLAILSLLAEAAEARPLLCLIDDVQWVDQFSAQLLQFVGRRLLAEPIVMAFAMREPVDSARLAGLPQLIVEGLADHDARELLNLAMPGRIDERVRERILAEARGNPLAVLELPRGLTPAELAGGFGLLDSRPLVDQSSAASTGGSRRFQRRLDSSW